MPSFQLCRSTGRIVKTDTIWQPTIQRQLGVNIYGGSYVVNLFKQKVYHKKVIIATVILHNNLFRHRLSDGLHCTSRPFTYVLRKDMSTLISQIKMYTVKKNCSQRNITQEQLEPYHFTEVLRWELYNSYTY